MRVVEITKPGGPEVLKVSELEKPVPNEREVLIKVKAAGVNRPDVVQRQGYYPAPKGASDIPGLEVSGVVERIGGKVNDVSIGDHVCALVQGGGYAEYCVAPIETVLPVPEGLSFIQAAAIPETYFTVWSNLFMRAGLKSGESLLVHGGSSGIGSTAIQLAKAFDVKVFTTVGSEEKAAFCYSLGADIAINYRTSDFEEQVNSETGSQGVNVVLDMIGGEYLSKNIACLAPDGRHVSIAFLKGPKVELNMLPIMLKRLVLTGSTLRARDDAFKGEIAEVLLKEVWPLIETGKLGPIVDTVFNLDEAQLAHQLMEASTHKGKIILSVGN